MGASIVRKLYDRSTGEPDVPTLSCGWYPVPRFLEKDAVIGGIWEFASDMQTVSVRY